MKKNAMRLRPGTTVESLAAHPLLDVLTGAELVVYLRLVARTRRGRAVMARNAELHSNMRTAAAALRRLEEQGLVRTTRGHTSFDRTIEVL